LYPKQNVEKKLRWVLRMHKDLYNAAIANRKTQYERFGHSVSYYEQQNSLPAFKAVWTEYKQLGSQALQATLKRVDLAYQSYESGIEGQAKIQVNQTLFRVDLSGYLRMEGTHNWRQRLFGID
jgi:putative transposase